MSNSEWKVWRARFRWLHWPACGVGVANIVIGHVYEGLAMIAICVAAERGLAWLDATDREMRSRFDALQARMAESEALAKSGTTEPE